jgi:hypothetical protein
VEPAVLIVQRRVDEHRLLGDVDAEALVQDVLAGELLLDGARTVQVLDHRRVEPHTESARGGGHAESLLRALLDDGSSLDVARLALVDELVALDVHEVRTDAAELLGDEDAFRLLREDHARGVVLDRVQEAHGHAGSVRHHRAVEGGAVMIRRHEGLDVQTPAAAGGHHDRLGTHHDVLFRLHVVEQRAGALASVVEDELDRGRELDDRDVGSAIARLVTDGAHDFRARDVRGVVHALARRSAAMHGLEPAVGELGEVHAEVLEPLEDVRGLVHESLDEVRDVDEVAAAHDVEVVEVGRVLVPLGGALDAALRHHGVGVAVTKLGGDEDLGALFLGEKSRRGACAAAADDEDVGLHVDLGQVDHVGVDAGLGLEQVGVLVGKPVALAGPDGQGAPALFLDVGVEAEGGVTLVERHEGDLFALLLALHALRTGRLYLLDEFFQCFGVRHVKPLLRGSRCWRGSTRPRTCSARSRALPWTCRAS